MDLAKYRAVFIEESAEHLAEMGRALIELEKQPTNAEAIDSVFRMAHSIKGMAASLEYDSITELAHRIEDRMELVRNAGCVEAGEFTLLFSGLDGLEAMVSTVRDTGEPPPPNAELLEAFCAATSAPPTAEPKKKVPSPMP